MSFIDSLGQLWSGFLDLVSKFVVPDWGAVVALIPILLVVGVVGPILALLALVYVYYLGKRPRYRARYEDAIRPAPRDASGGPVFPTGEPYCARDALLYPVSAVRCRACRDELSVICPKCGVGRRAVLSTCGNCGLVLKVQTRLATLATVAGPPPGGAAAA